MPDEFERIKAILGVANEAIKQQRAADAAAALAQALPLLAQRIAEGTSFSAIVTTQATLLSLLAGNPVLARDYAELVVDELGTMLEKLGADFTAEFERGEIDSARSKVLIAYTYALAFVPFVPASAPIASLEELAPTGGAEVNAILMILRQVRPKLDAVGWAAWPYPEEAARKARYWSAHALTTVGAILVDNLGTGRDVEDAQQLADASLGLLAGTEPGQLFADALNLKGRALQRYGYAHLSEAIPFFEQAIDVLEKLPVPNLVDAAVDHSNLGAVYLTLADFEAANARPAAEAEAAAERHLNAAIAIYREHDPYRRLPGALGNLAVLCVNRQLWQQAFDLGHEAWTIVENDPRYDSDVRAKIALNLGGDFSKQQKYDEAEPWYRKALAAIEAGQTTIDPEAKIAANGGLGVVLLRTTGAQAADPYLSQAVAALESYRTSFLSEQPNSELLKRLEWIYEAYIEACAQLGAQSPARRNDAFDTAERIKWRTMTAVLRFRPLELPGLGDDQALVDEEQQLLAFLQPLLLGPAAQAGHTPRTKAALQRLDEIWTALEPKHPEHVAIRRQQTARVADVTAVLDAEVPVLIEYFLGSEYGAAFAFVVRRDDPAPAIVRLAQSSDQLRSLVEELRSHDAQTPAATFNAALQHLYQAILEPVLPLIPEGAGVCIVPYGVLHNVPFGALYDGTRYFIERNAIVIAASASALRWWIRKDRAGRSRCLIFTATSGIRSASGKLPDLVLFEDLARRQIAPLFPGATVIAGTQATKGNLLAQLVPSDPPWDVAHLACHGVFQPQGYDSFLALAADPQRPDTNLSALEIASQVRPDTSLVTLSACDSGIAQTSTGDEVAGLAQAFLMAGSSSVIASLWLVRQDAGVAVTQRFYDDWLSGRDPQGRATKIRSLQAAQCRILRKKGWFSLGPDFSHPYLWAAFQLYGNWI